MLPFCVAMIEFGLRVVIKIKVMVVDSVTVLCCNDRVRVKGYDSN